MRLPAVAAILATGALAASSLATQGASSTAAGVTGPGVLVADHHDLGTLGGSSAWATAVSGSVVVGQSATKTGQWHAFAYDLSRPRRGMRDLGRLDGIGSSGATGVDGQLVVGTAGSRRGSRSWVLDLSTRQPHMVDMGALGKGLRSQFHRGPAIEDGVAVGIRGFGSNNLNHAFAYDTSVPRPHAVDLGTLGGPTSAAVAIDDGLVVGISRISPDNNRTHVFGYDLRATSPQMVDLTPGPTSARVVGVSQGLVLAEHGSQAFVVDARTTPLVEVPLGNEETWRPTALGDGLAGGQGFWNTPGQVAFDLTKQPPVAVSVGSLGLPGPRLSSSESGAVAVDEGLVVGEESNLLGWRAFASDAASVIAGVSQTGEITDLGFGLPYSRVSDVEGHTVVGSASPYNRPNRDHAYAWTIHRTTGAVVSIKTTEVDVEEWAGGTSVELVRTGDLSSAAIVVVRPRRVVEFSASGGADYGRASQKVTFSPGQSVAAVDVPIVDDGKPEQMEQFAVELASATGADVGVPSASVIRIAPNDQTVDAMVRRIDQPVFTGAGIIGGEPAAQTVQAAVRPGSRMTFYVRALNNVLGSKRAVRLSSSAVPGLRVRYFHAGTEITGQITSEDGWVTWLGPRRYTELTVRVRVPVDAATGSAATVDLAGTLVARPSTTDTVHVAVQVP